MEKSLVKTNLLPDHQVVSPVSSDFQTEGDFNLVHRLLRHPRYEIPERLRKKVIDCVESVVDKETADDDVKLRAIKVLSELDKHNIELVKIAMPKKVEHTDVSRLNDEELLARVQDIVKRLPPVLDVSPTLDVK
jgi:hypothetical protein